MSQLPIDLHDAATRLPARLGLSSRTNIGWGEVFDDVAFLGLPMLLLNENAEAIDDDICTAAQRAHLCAMIAALIHDRLARKELEPDAALCGILLALERERERTVSRLCARGGFTPPDCYAAEREARNAIAKEQAIFEGHAPARIQDYLAICAAKHSPAFPVTMAAAVASGFELDARGHVHELVLGVMLGIAARDEVNDWLTRAQFGRSWAVMLVDKTQTQSDVVRQLLELAASAFARATHAAEALGGHRLAHWTSGQEYAVCALANAETLEPGYALFRDRPRTTLPAGAGVLRAA